MAIIKCKMCGGSLEISEDMSVAECEYCGTKQTVPKVDDEKKLTLFARANRLRLNNEFDKAAGIYESIIADFPEEAEAYWGLVLCTYGIEYVDDPATAKKVPTCHRSSFESVMDDANFEQACENADATARRVYRDEAKAIEELRKRIIEVSSKEEPYDVFISYKELDENGERTIDSVIAQDIYKELTGEGYRVFFSRISLEDKLGVEYEPYIFAALNSAKVMLVVGTDFENFNAVWVKNEWSRFLMLIAKGEKKTLIPCFKDIDAYDMPKEFNKLAAQDMGKVGAMQDLVRGVEKIIGGKKEEKPAAKPVHQSESNAKGTAALKRGFMALEDREWANADKYFEQALELDAECAEAYWGKFLAERKCNNAQDMVKNIWYLKGSPKPACGINTVRIEKSVEENIVPKYFDPEDIAKLYEFDINYIETETEARQKISGMMSEVNSNRVLARAKQFAGAELKTQLYDFFKKLKHESDKAIAEAQKADADRKQTVVNNYQAHLDAADKKALEKKADAECRMKKEIADAEYRRKKKIAVETLSKSISASNHTVALKTDGTVVATGNNSNNQCKVSSMNGIAAVSAGAFNTVFLRDNGTVAAIGADAYLQCDVANWRNIVAIASGTSFTVGLKSDGTVVAVGHNSDGRCDVWRWKDIIAISAGAKHTVGLKADGTVVAVGDNKSYQCSVTNWKDIIAISARGCHTVGLKADGTVVAVGDGRNGQCIVINWTDIIAISAGEHHTVGLKADGTVVAVGDNASGQCNVTGWTDIIAISAGVNHTVGIKTDGTVLATKYIGDASLNKGQCNVANWKLFNNYLSVTTERLTALAAEKEKLTAELPTLQGVFKAGRRKEVEARLEGIEKMLKKLS